MIPIAAEKCDNALTGSLGRTVVPTSVEDPRPLVNADFMLDNALLYSEDRDNVFVELPAS